MAASARLKHLRRTSGAPGAPASLLSAEIAYNMVDGTLYIGKGDDGSGNATSVVAFAKDTYADLDADLVAIGALSGTSGLLKKTAANTWTLDTTTYQVQDADLDALAGLDATAGLLVKTGANAYTRRSLATAASSRIAVSNTDGSAGNPTIDLGQPTIGGGGAGAGFTKVSVDVYGRVTNTATATLTDISAPTGTWSAGANLLQSSAVPSGGNDLTNKAYVDAAILAAQLGADAKASVRAATTGALPANNATSTTLTGTANGALAAQDGVTLVQGDRLLVKNEVAQANNGIYTLTTVGTAGTPYVLTRATDFDAWTEIPGASVTVEEGSTLADHLFLSIANTGGTLGTTAIGFNDITGGASGFTVAGAGLTSSGGTVDVAAGTGITVAADNVALTGQALALHNVATAADKLIYATGSGTFTTTDFTSVARTLLAQTTQANLRSTGLGLGTIATQNANAVAITGGTIDGVVIDGGTF